MELTKQETELLTKVFRERIADLQREQHEAQKKLGSATWYDKEIADTRNLLHKLRQETV